MFTSENLKEVYEQKSKRWQCGVERILLACGTQPVDRNRAPGIAMTTSQTIFTATPQFDGGRWKLRLERAPSSTDRQFTGPVFSSIALGFTMLSPLVLLVTTYLWAWVFS
jgi:hypothetical protein